MQLSVLLEFDDIVIQCHDFPDADALASGYGVYIYLKSHGKNPIIIYSGKQRISKPNLIHITELFEIPIQYVETLDRHEALVTVDCCYGEGNVTRFPADNIFVIDHHRLKAPCEYRCEIKSSYSSCATVVAQMMRKEQFDYNKDKRLATALYFGLYSDSNGMNEINHPADRDLRDLAEFDEITINLLKNSNLSLEEMKIAGDALKHYKYNDRFGYAIVEAMPCDPNILGFICDLLLQVDAVNTCVVFCSMQNGTKISVRSCINDIRANELAEFIVDGNGTGGGHALKAGGKIDPLADGTDAAEYIRGRIDAYHLSYDIIHADSYTVNTSEMTRFRKKRFTVGYVKSTDVFSAGTEMCVRTLEGDLNVCADDGLYIMIGISGEVYPIKKDKFEHSYLPLNGKFYPNADYFPTVIEKSTFTSIELLPYIRSCVSTGSYPIFVRALDRTVKVYTSWDNNNYMLGKVGDYLAARCDDLHDIYVIRRSIFDITYERDDA